MANTTWKQLVYDAADAYRTASATETQVKVGELATKISSLEDVTAEVEVQTPLVDQIMTALIGKVGDDANATAETILEGYKAWVQGEKVVGTYKPHGLYVWKKYEYESSTVGDFVDYVVSDTETEYPDGDVKDGYWYEKIIGGIGIIEKFFGCTEYTEDTFTLSSNSSAYETKINHSLGKVPKLIFLYTEWNLPDSYIKYAMIDNTQELGTVYAYLCVENSPYANYGFNVEGSFNNTRDKQPTSNSFYLGSTNEYFSGIEYKVITMA